jgi:hypothetical protein
MADTLDVITLTEAKNAINIAASDTSQDTELAGYVTAVSRRLDTLCGPIVQRTVSNETYYVSYDQTFIDLKVRPVASITSCTEYTWAGDATTLSQETVSVKPNDAYLLDPSPLVPYRLQRRVSGVPYRFYPGGSVVITYVAGRTDTTANVDPVFKQGATIMLSQLWRREQGVGTQTFGLPDQGGTMIPTFAVPRAVIELLAEHLRPMGVA